MNDDEQRDGRLPVRRLGATSLTVPRRVSDVAPALIQWRCRNVLEAVTCRSSGGQVVLRRAVGGGGDRY
jgi:hypothetical protein